MLRAAFFLFALFGAWLALASSEEARSCARRTQLAQAPGAVTGLATSVHSTSLYTLAWRGQQLYRLADRSDRIGKIFEPATELLKLPLPADKWASIALVAVQSEANSIHGSTATVALADGDGSLFVFDTDDMHTARLPYQAGRYVVGLALAKGESSTQLVVFSNQGIEVASLPQRLDHEVRLQPKLAYGVSAIQGGFALRANDFVAFDHQGQITRYTDGKTTPVGKLPQGIRSLGGYLSRQSLQLWAIDSKGILWRKKDHGKPFRRWRAQMPPGVAALRLTASGGVVYPESHTRESWTEGYYARTSQPTGYGMGVDRVFLVAEDGSVYSPFPATDDSTELWKITPSQDLQEKDGMNLPIEFRNVLKGSHLKPREIRAAMKHLAETLENLAGIEVNLADIDQTVLLRTWLNHLMYERYLDTPGAGIEETLTQIGVPPQRAARLIFLDCLGFQESEALLTQRDLEKYWAHYQEINRLLMLGGHAFRRQMAHSAESRRLLDYFASHVRIYLQAEKDRFLNQILEAPFSDRPIYFAMDAYFAQRTYLWHWNLERETEDSSPPGPKSTTGGASAE